MSRAPARPSGPSRRRWSGRYPGRWTLRTAAVTPARLRRRPAAPALPRLGLPRRGPGRQPAPPAVVRGAARPTSPSRWRRPPTTPASRATLPVAALPGRVARGFAAGVAARAAPVATRSWLFPVRTDLPVHRAFQRRGVALQRRQPDVEVAAFEAGHCRLRGPHPGSDLRLTPALLLAERDQLLHQLSAPRRQILQPGEQRLTLRTIHVHIKNGILPMVCSASGKVSGARGQG